MIRREDYQYLRKLDDFCHFSIEQFDKIVGQMEFRQAKKDHMLFFEGDKRDRLFLVTSGYLRLSSQIGQEPLPILISYDMGQFFPTGGCLQMTTIIFRWLR